jgi:hypothetical protein
MDQPKGAKSLPVFGVFPDGAELMDAYSGEIGRVARGAIALATPFELVLLSRRPAAGSDSVVVYVSNNYAIPMEVYAAGSGTDYRMGTVNPGIVSRFVLRWDVLGTNRQVEFVAQASGYGPRVRTGRIYVSPGDIVDFEISPQLVGSRAVVRP